MTPNRFVYGFTLIILTVACSSSGVIEETNPIESYLKHERSSLGVDQLSNASVQFLEQRDLYQLYLDTPLEAIRRIFPILKADRERQAAFALAEACYLEVRQQSVKDVQARLLCSALLYSYAYLFEQDLVPLTNKFDPNFRRACELYNRCLGILVDATNKDASSSTDGSYSLPLLEGGPIKTKNGVAELAWDPKSFDSFFVSYDYNVKDIGPLNRFYGVGAPCIALRSPRQETAAEKYLAQAEQAYACTVFMRFEGSVLEDLSEIRATIELYDPLKTDRVKVGKEEVPLEADLTTPLAYMFEKAPRPQELSSLLDVEAIEESQGLYMLQPYQRDKIPLVFVHGLLSTQITWLKMMNGVLRDPRIRKRYQIWFFFYPTANPILLSASVLRKSLIQIRRTFDPQRKDPEFDQMVVVGHSMGGVLSRYMIQSSGNRLWELISDKPLESYGLEEKQREVIRGNFFFEPVPHIRRVIFLASPHRGSDLADGILGTVANWLTSIPEKTMQSARTLGSLVRRESETEAFFRNPPSGVNSLSPSNPFNKAGVDLPFAKRVKYHCIVGNVEADNEPGGSDGIVPYESSRLDDAVSELIVRSGHSVHTRPKAILEVRRILDLHLDQRNQELEVENQAKKAKSPGGG